MSAASRALLRDRLFWICVVASLAISLLAAAVLTRGIGYSLYDTANLVGPTAKSLLDGRGLEVAYDYGSLNGPIDFHGARMPMASFVVAALIALVGPQRFLLASLCKTVLFLVPIWATMRLVLRSVDPEARRRASLLLLGPFAMTAFLANVVNIPVEEGYAYSLLAYAVALVLFPDAAAEAERPFRRAILLGLSLVGLFLTKSSLILVAAVLIVAYLAQQRRWAPRLVVVLFVLGAVVGWGLEQKGASGRFALGTSLDGINLHKGNNARFAERYPPAPGENLDGYDGELNEGQFFVSEWAFDDYHKSEAVRYMREHPAETLRADATKAYQYYVSLSKSGSMESQGPLRLAESAGLAAFRLGFWLAVVLSIRAIATGKGPGRFAAWTFLGIALFGALPYILGFAYTRHASVLIYPTALLLCRMLPVNNAKG